LRAELVADGRKRAEDFSLERTSAQLLALLDGFVR
jgi:hypothetical protein